ncbi:MAG: hypothetical protein AAFO07_21705 [Bacteroidota bacterium]
MKASKLLLSLGGLIFLFIYTLQAIESDITALISEYSWQILCIVLEIGVIVYLIRSYWVGKKFFRVFTQSKTLVTETEKKPSYSFFTTTASPVYSGLARFLFGNNKYSQLEVSIIYIFLIIVAFTIKVLIQFMGS